MLSDRSMSVHLGALATRQSTMRFMMGALGPMRYQLQCLEEPVTKSTQPTSGCSWGCQHVGGVWLSSNKISRHGGSGKPLWWPPHSLSYFRAAPRERRMPGSPVFGTLQTSALYASSLVDFNLYPSLQ